MRLLFVGDVMLGREVDEVLKGASARYPWGNTLKSFLEADWRLCNLECVISDRGAPWEITPKTFHFRSAAKNIAVLREAKIDAVSLANNHVLDFGDEAMSEMINLLENAKIRHAGAGMNLEAASAMAVSEARGKKIGLLAFTDNQPEWSATTQKRGVWYVPVDVDGMPAQLLFDRVRSAHKQVDVVIVSAHWGPNWGYEPPAAHVAFAHKLIDLGADVVFGHSGHVVRGIEAYRSRPIMYCTGNFIDDYYVDPTERNDESGIFSVDVTGGRISKLLLRPTVIRDCHAELASEEHAVLIGAKISRLCGELGTQATWLSAPAILEIRL